jgi:AcrR family transcriptional regulator
MNNDILSGRGKSPTQARRKPLQARAQKRHEQILEVTAELLEQVGIDDLTTIIIAKKLNISVGSLYHYFPNKVAILYALAEQWLNDMTEVVTDIDNNIEKYTDYKDYSNNYIESISKVYHRQRGVLSIIQGMYGIPELRELDEQHDQLMIKKLSQSFSALGFQSSTSELTRVSYLYVEFVNAMNIAIIDQKGAKAKKNLQDINVMGCTLIAQHFSS